MNITVAQLKEEDGRIRKGRFAYLATCQCGASAVLSSNAKGLVTDENTQVWSTKAYDRIQRRVLNISLCTHTMGQPFFFEPSLYMEYYHSTP